LQLTAESCAIACATARCCLRVELADLSPDILAHAGYFEAGNKGVLADPKVVVHVNDAPAGIARDEQIDTVRTLPMETGVIDLNEAVGNHPESACYACLFPEDAQVEEVQCSTMGVFAPLTGVIGAMQAMEAIKLVARVGEPAALQILDAKSAEWRSVRVKKDPGCTVCGKNQLAG